MGRSYVAIITYTLALVLLGYFSLKSLIYSVMNPSFPNIQFILTIILMIVFSWVIGISVKKYIKKYANGNEKVESNLRVFFVAGTVIASILFLVLFKLA
ncbi:MAG TPA: hypothetical protein GX497_02800 [Bacillus bacterium]|nr:hypothetical protein [Bacillus sp. (in: firmicutes)]